MWHRIIGVESQNESPSQYKLTVSTYSAGMIRCRQRAGTCASDSPSPDTLGHTAVAGCANTTWTKKDPDALTDHSALSVRHSGSGSYLPVPPTSSFDAWINFRVYFGHSSKLGHCNFNAHKLCRRIFSSAFLCCIFRVLKSST